jgi:hypothetical protein
VAWKIVKATEKGAWKPYWLELFTYIQDSIPKSWMVIVCAERGLYADWLYHKIIKLGWHPYLRINSCGFFQHRGEQPWIECSFKDTKRGGFLWHQTKTTDPVRAERHWLAIAIAMLWLVSVGGSDETANSQQFQSYNQQPQVFSTSTSPSSPPRLLSCFRRGFLSILVALLWGQPLPVGHFYSFAWTNSISFSCA